jgi:type IV secretion system protein VirB5
MPSLHKSTSYKSVNVQNPFLEGQDKAYADLLREKQLEMRWWRYVIGVGILVLSVVNLIFFIYATNLQKIVPVLVNIMPNGEAEYLGEVRQNADFAVPEAAIQFQIRSFITDLRSISTDPQMVYNNINACYAMVTSSFEPVMTSALRNSNPITISQEGKTRRTVAIESVLKITGASYQIDWTETTRDSSAIQKSVRMRAVVTVKLLAVNESSIRSNPLGIYIDNCEMTEL